MAERIVEWGRLGLVEEPIDVAVWLAEASHPACGAASLFLGVVRNHHDQRAVRHLEYEAYDDMVLGVFEQIAGELRARWDVRRLALAHRKGRLEIGEVAVLVAVATPHRQDAFEACRYGIDEIKRRAPIWKKEIYVEGQACWVENPEGAAES